MPRLYKSFCYFVGCVFVVPLFAGCRSMNHTENGALVGTGIGATTGAIIGHQSGHGEGGALIGAAAGALGGALVGNAQQMSEERDAAVAAAQQAEWRRHADAQAVTNQDVIRMARGGLSEEVIAGTIRSRGGRFDLSPDALIVLKSEGVGDGVIQAMQTSGGPQYVAGATTVNPQTVMTVPGPPSTVYVAPRPTAQIVIGPRRWHRRPRLHRRYW
ncbi:YMGG-like glycine zipper-containing protein [Symmachiella dynata]|uniref:YMGG-like Gly-zipper domain-containing protein n=1 Tax=Symmachiella dynata TaxID=2527995 RepID=A0A517ZHL8_9PLAN|nr:YMGG-like glycine zipper-containing protein [Symmachiella dynata]QDU41978.1 hypothetical protein Mal52_04330 [Symmachiella dynata]